MKAGFDTVVRYDIRAHCLAPMRTGNAYGDTEAVLRYADGTAFIQGSSIAGALRGFSEKAFGEKNTALLFGSQKNTGSLIVSDGVFDASAKQYIRPHVRIDKETGSAEKGGKYDIAHIASDGSFNFTVIWKGDSESIAQTDDVEKMLGAMHNGVITLGAQKTNGFGRVSLTVKKTVYDLKNEKDRDAWLNDEAEGAEIKLPDCRTKRVFFTVTGKAEDVLIKASASEQEGDKSYAVNISENGRAILPGSSIKGVVRARAEMIADYLHIDKELTEYRFGRMNRDGDNGLAGQITFSDMRMNGSERNITRIRINRFTGGVIRGGLFSEKPQSTDIKLEISVPDDPAGCALLLLALRDLGLGLCSLGSGNAVGRGYLLAESIEAVTADGRKGTLRFDGNGGYTAEGNELFSEWMKELEAWRDET